MERAVVAVVAPAAGAATVAIGCAGQPSEEFGGLVAEADGDEAVVVRCGLAAGLWRHGKHRRRRKRRSGKDRMIGRERGTGSEEATESSKEKEKEDDLLTQLVIDPTCRKFQFHNSTFSRRLG